MELFGVKYSALEIAPYMSTYLFTTAEAAAEHALKQADFQCRDMLDMADEKHAIVKSYKGALPVITMLNEKGFETDRWEIVSMYVVGLT